MFKLHSAVEKIVIHLYRQTNQFVWLAILTTLSFILPGPSFAQVPSATLGGTAATPLIGEQSCTTAEFKNLDSTEGYGPYLFVTLPVGVTVTTNSFVGISPPVENVGTVDQSGMIADPISGQSISGDPGGSAFIIRYPVGSVVQGQVPLVLDVCIVTEAGVEVGVPLQTVILPGFEYGDTPTGDNGPVTGNLTTTGVITPQLARVTKTTFAPEHERPPGPSHPYSYSYSMDVSEGITIRNVNLSDILPDEVQWTGGLISVNAQQGALCQVFNNPNAAPVPGGALVVRCASLTGTTSTNDLTVTLPVYITDILNQSNANTQNITNTVNVEYHYDNTEYNDTDDAVVTAKHVATQKTVNQDIADPGDIITYTVRFQVTDYSDTGGEGLTSLVLDDILSDGLSFVGNSTLTINGADVYIDPAEAPGPGTGQSTITFDIAQANGGSIPLGSDGTLTYQVEILQTLSDGTPIVASDDLGNDIQLDYTHSEGANGSDNSDADVVITPNTSNKLLVAPTPLPSSLAPGDTVTFRLQLEVPAGDTKSISFTDFLPLPVTYVADIDPNTDVVVPNISGISSVEPIYSADIASNSFTLTWQDPAGYGSTIVAADITVTITDVPFADGLYLTNLLQTTTTNNAGQVETNLIGKGFTVGAPELVLTKGVFAVDNPAATINPAPPADPTQALADSDATGLDAGDEVTYIITIENTGSQSAWNLNVTDPAVSGLSCAPLSVGDVTSGSGQNMPFSGNNLQSASGITIAGPVPGNDNLPAGGGAPFSGDTVFISQTCTIDTSALLGDSITNNASVSYTSTDSSNQTFPESTDNAAVTLASPTISKEILAVTPGYANSLQQVQIGEIVDYRVTVSIPEGTSPDVYFEDLLDAGLAFVELTAITASAGVTTSVPGGFIGVINNAAFTNQGSGDSNLDRLMQIGPAASDFGFGTIINSNIDNTTQETITLEYRTRVLNTTSNIRGAKRNNQASWSWANSAGRQLAQISAPTVNIIEPTLELTKTFTPNTVDRGNDSELQIRVRHTGGSNATAYQVDLRDLFPLGIQLDTPSLTFNNCDLQPDDVQVTSTTLQALWQEFPVGSDCTISVAVMQNPPLPAGGQITNCAIMDWTSLDDIDLPLPQPPNNPLGVERTGQTSDTGGSANTYEASSCADLKIFDVLVDKAVESSTQINTARVGTFEELAVGEEVTFLLTATLPEDPVLDLVIEDSLPISGMVLEALSAEVLPLSNNTRLTVPNFPPVPVLEDNLLGDGINDTVVISFGSPILNSPDGVVNDDDRIHVRVTARVRNLPINQNLAEDRNLGRVRFGNNSIGTSQAPLRVVEPLLGIVKTGDVTNVEAGDTINFTLAVSQLQQSRSDAFDVNLLDVLPPELSVVPGSVATGDCSLQPDVGPSSNGSNISANWITFPLGNNCEILFTATVLANAVAGSTIDNESTIQWVSLDGTEPDDSDERSYLDQSSWEVLVGNPAMKKSLTGTSIIETNGQSLTIGETATFEIVVEFPDGVTSDVRVADLLPSKNAGLEVISATISSIGSDLTLPGGATVGDDGDACQPDCGTQTLGYDSLASWNLGEVDNAPDSGTPISGPAEQIVFEVVGIVKDLPVNQGIPVGQDPLYNTAGLDSLNFQAGDQAPVTLVEPRLALEHSLNDNSPFSVVSAGETVKATLTVSHLPTSSAPAFNLRVEDTLNPQVNWVNDNTVSTSCPGLTTDSSAAPVIRFDFAQLPTAFMNCEITFDVQMSQTLPLPGAYTDTSVLRWESSPGSVESRSGEDADSVLYLTSTDGVLGKRIQNSSVLLTRRNQSNPLVEDLTIGETITYELVAGLAEGTNDNVVLSDTLPQGLEILGATLSTAGANISTSLTGTPVVTGQNVNMDFGTVTNVADGIANADDLLGVSITARVLDVPANQDGVLLTNSGLLEFGIAQQRTSQANVELVVPELSLDKQFGSLNQGRVDITLTVTNTGTAPAFSTAITDVFDESVWVAGSLQEVLVPNGWKLDVQSAAGQTTVTFEADGSPIQPQPSQILLPGGSRTVVFSMALITPATLPTVDNTANASADSLRNGDPAARTVTAQATASLPQPILDATKAWSGVNNPAVPGDSLTYTIEITNTGDADATMVIIDDTPDALGEFQAGSVVAPGGTVITGNFPTDTSISVEFASIPAQGSVSFSYEVRVPDPYPAGVAKQFVNQAVISSEELVDFMSDDPATPQQDDDPTIAPIVAEPIMRIVKDDVSDVVGAGGTIFYQLDFANTGNQDATGVVITDQVPDHTVFNAAGSSVGWSCPDLSPPATTCTYTVGNLDGGQGGTIYFAVTVDDPIDASITQIDNTAFITDDDNHTDDDDDDTRIVAAPVLDISKDDGGISTSSGGIVVYQLDYVNNGTRNATGVHLQDVVPPNSVFDAAASLPDVWSCPDGSAALTVCELDVGDLEGSGIGAGQANFAVRVDRPLPSGIDQINNRVLIADDGSATLGIPIIALAFDGTPVIAAPDLVIDKDDSGIIGQPGEVITYTLSYQQVGDQDATGVFITETVPVGSTYSAAGSLSDVWSCADGSPAGSSCTLQLGAQPVGSSGVAYFGLMVADPLPAGQSEIINTAVIADDGANGPDPTPANNTDTVATLVTLFPPAGRKTVEETSPGHVIWEMVWFNNQNTTNLPVSIYDPIPAGSNYVANSVTCTATGSSQCLSAIYNAAENRIEVEAIIAPDFGKPDLTPASLLDNEILVSLETTVASSTPLSNIADACWDENNSGSADDDRAMGQTCITVTANIGLLVAIPLLSNAGLALLILLMLLAGSWHRRLI